MFMYVYRKYIKDSVSYTEKLQSLRPFASFQAQDFGCEISVVWLVINLETNSPHLINIKYNCNEDYQFPLAMKP